MQPQANRAVRSIERHHAMRGRLSNNVIQWREVADAKRTQSSSLDQPLIPEGRQNKWLGLIAVVTVLVVGARMLGLL